ncbi:MAG: HAD-IC family P-type ATPase [Candidatus Paceibacterota bacterium]
MHEEIIQHTGRSATDFFHWYTLTPFFSLSTNVDAQTPAKEWCGGILDKMTAWETKEIEDIRFDLETSLTEGLSRDDVVSRLARDGENAFKPGKQITLWGKIFKQIKSPLVLILLGAGVATLFLQEYLDALVVFAALGINVVVGVFQEQRASKAFEKLNASQERRAVVLRDGKKQMIDAKHLVVGDVVLLEAGYAVPADVRLSSTNELSINEAPLTGEWLPVGKETKVMEKGRPLAERFNMAWMGTLVTTGMGKGIVIATGDKTEIGKIAESLSTIEEESTPLQKSVERLARFLLYIILTAVLIIAVLGIARGESLAEVFLIAIALAVATIPAGLPAAVTVVLAIGMESILKKGGLVRNLLAAETLGATTIVLTDKTGTLTEARMQLHSLYSRNAVATGNHTHPDNETLLKMAVLASDAFIERDESKKEGEEKVVVHGRPIEKAIILKGLEEGCSQEKLFEKEERIDFLKFQSSRRFAASLNRHPEGNGNRMYITGAPELILEKVKRVLSNGKAINFSQKDKDAFYLALDTKTREGMRFIAVAYKDTKEEKISSEATGRENEHNEVLEDVVLAGLLAFSDPVRLDVAEAISKVKGAGARVLMVTGDNAGTAFAVAKAVGITKDQTRVRLGSTVDECESDQDLIRLINMTDAFARATPKQKLRIAEVLQGKGEIVAMTGDGINDAPALQRANIGVAVGSGTEVAKAASDIILLDNSFSIIVAAIEEGRKIVDNLKKIIAYLLSTSFSEVFVIGAALVAGAPLPLLPTQILWANIIEEGTMSFPFAFEPKSKGLMRRKPSSSRATNIMTPALKKLIFIISAVTGIFLVGLYFILLQLDLPIEEVRTLMFASLSLDAIFFAFSIKNLEAPIWKINIFSNKLLLVSLFISITILIGTLTLPPLQALLSLTTPTPIEFGFLLLIGLFNLLVIEVVKYFIFEKKRVV